MRDALVERPFDGDEAFEDLVDQVDVPQEGVRILAVQLDIGQVWAAGEQRAESPRAIEKLPQSTRYAAAL